MYWLMRYTPPTTSDIPEVRPTKNRLLNGASLLAWPVTIHAIPCLPLKSLESHLFCCLIIPYRPLTANWVKKRLTIVLPKWTIDVEALVKLHFMLKARFESQAVVVLSFFAQAQRNHSGEFVRIHNSLAQQQLRKERKPIYYAL